MTFLTRLSLSLNLQPPPVTVSLRHRFILAAERCRQSSPSSVSLASFLVHLSLSLSKIFIIFLINKYRDYKNLLATEKKKKKNYLRFRNSYHSLSILFFFPFQPRNLFCPQLRRTTVVPPPRTVSFKHDFNFFYFILIQFN